MRNMKASELFDRGANPPGDDCGLRAQYADGGGGIALYLVQGGAQACRTAVDNDSDRVHFSYWLRGTATGTAAGRRFDVGSGQAVVAYAPGQHFEMQLSAGFCNVEIMVTPERLASLAGDVHLNDEICHGGCLHAAPACLAAREAAARLARLMATGRRGGLLLEAVALEALAWQLDAGCGDSTACPLPRREREALLCARECLLADLAQAPTIAELARTVGLNAMKLKRGFRLLFGTSVYALYQQARMAEARKLLDCSNVSDTAAALGYSNVSHFSAAFRKAFGVLPSEVRRRTD